jgi:GT2 family glycosyltransferase
MARISVLIVNYNSGGRLARCLSRLGAQTFRDFEIIVADNASEDDSVARAKAGGVAARFLDAGANIGFAAANNLAARCASGEWLAFLNPDAYAQDDWLAEIVAASQRYPWAEAFGSTQLKADDPARVDGAGDVCPIYGVPYRGHFGFSVDRLPPDDAECFSPCAAAAVYARAAFERLGGFDERFFCYGEDVDLGFRLRLGGGRAVQLRRAVVLHEGSGVAGRKSKFTVYQGHRNRLWLLSKNMPTVLLAALFPARIIVSVMLFAPNSFMGLGPTYLRALWDGYKGHPDLPAQRRTIAAGRKISIKELMAAMAWSPLKFLRREAVLRPICAPGDDAQQ